TVLRCRACANRQATLTIFGTCFVTRILPTVSGSCSRDPSGLISDNVPAVRVIWHPLVCASTALSWTTVACHDHGTALRVFWHEHGTTRLPMMGPPGVSRPGS